MQDLQNLIGQYRDLWLERPPAGDNPLAVEDMLRKGRDLEKVVLARAIAMRDAHDLPLDDRALIQRCGDVMGGGGTDQFDPALKSLVVWFSIHKCAQK